MREHKVHFRAEIEIEMDNRGETSTTDVVFEYTGVGCSVPKDVTSVRVKEGLQKIGDGAFKYEI